MMGIADNDLTSCGLRTAVAQRDVRSRQLPVSARRVPHRTGVMRRRSQAFRKATARDGPRYRRRWRGECRTAAESKRPDVGQELTFWLESRGLPPRRASSSHFAAAKASKRPDPEQCRTSMAPTRSQPAVSSSRPSAPGYEPDRVEHPTWWRGLSGTRPRAASPANIAPTALECSGR